MDRRMIFKYADYRDFLSRLQERSRIVPLSEWVGPGDVILRHDVDLDVGAAIELAQLEHELGVRSSYLILLSADTYNVRSADVGKQLRELVQLGFDVGVHFYPPAYGLTDVAELQPYVDREAEQLESISGAPVRSVSIHNPSLHGGYPLFDSYRNAYDPAIFGPDRYLSDSRMVFSTDPDEFFARPAPWPRQLLLHPVHYTPNGDGYPEIVRRIVGRFVDQLDTVMRVNSTYAAQVPSPLRERFMSTETSAHS